MMFYKEENTDLFLMQGRFVAKFNKSAEGEKNADNSENLADENAKITCNICFLKN